MILYNTDDDQSLLTDNHHLPAILVDYRSGLALKAFIANKSDPMAKIRILGPTAAAGSVMASFSSRGPTEVIPDLIKPDVTAPGVQILAAHSPAAGPSSGAPGQSFQVISGTSMSSPHVAGIAALLREAHPSWSPARIKSAIVTSADPGPVKKEDGRASADPFDMGGGQLNPNPAVDPGLAYDLEIADYLGLDAIFGGPLATVDLNLPSVALAKLTTDRSGVDVEVDPPLLDLGSPVSGADSASYQIHLSVREDLLDERWVFGSLSWSDGVRQARSPLAIRALAFDAPRLVTGQGTAGSLDFDVVFNYTGDYEAQVEGLVPATEETRNVQQSITPDPQEAFFCFVATNDPSCGVSVHIVTVPPGTELARFALFDDFTDGDDELNMFVLRFPVTDPESDLVGFSVNPGATESVTLEPAEPGDYLVGIHAPQTEGPDTNYTLFTWLVGDDDAGNTSVTAPPAAEVGTTGTVTLEWSGLEGNAKYLGRLVHLILEGRRKTTTVEVDTNTMAPVSPVSDDGGEHPWRPRGRGGARAK
jgi:hypothetical protein